VFEALTSCQSVLVLLRVLAGVPENENRRRPSKK
jgi:hypothetical protein